MSDTLFGRPIVEADIGIPSIGDLWFGPTSTKVKARIVSQHDNGDGTWTIGVTYDKEEPCPQHPSGTAHLATPEAGQSTDPTARSEDTTDTGHD